jgi:hypothetical protein
MNPISSLFLAMQWAAQIYNDTELYNIHFMKEEKHEKSVARLVSCWWLAKKWLH